MTTEPGGAARVDGSTSSPKRAFYQQLSHLMNEGGFNRHMDALCKPFISNTTGPEWWSSEPSSYFRILFVGYLEGIESEQELCWAIEDSQTFREFVGLGSSAAILDATTLAQIRQPLMPLIHSEAFDTLMRLVEKSGLLDGRVPGLDISAILSDPAVNAIVARLRSKDHHNYWRRLTKSGGTSWSTRPSAPPRSGGTGRSPFTSANPAQETERFAMWLEDLSLAQTEINELRNRGVSDFRAEFAQGTNPVIDHVIRACIYGRGPNSVRAFTSAASEKSERDLPQQMTAASLDACREIAVALAEGKKQVAVEVPLLNAEGQPAVAAVQLTVAPDREETLQTVLVSFTDISARKRQQVNAPKVDAHIERTLALNHVGVWEWDVDSDATYWSDAMLSIYGVSREEFSGKHSDYLSCTYPEDREAERDSVRQSTADAANRSLGLNHPIAASTSFRDYRIKRQDGQTRWVRAGAVEVVDDQGRPSKLQGVMWDITESKQLELQLRESEEQYRRMVEDAPVPITVTAFDGEVIFANDCALAYFEASRDDMPRLRANDFWLEPEQRTDAMSILAEKGELTGYTARLRFGSNPDPRIVLLNAKVVEFAGRNVILSNQQDVTERERTTEQIQSIQRHATNLLEQQHRQLTLLNRVLMASDQSVDEMLETTCRELLQTFGLSQVAVLIATARGAALTAAAHASSDHRPARSGMQLPLSEGSLRAIFSDGMQPIRIADASADPRAVGFRALVEPNDTTSLLLAPLTSAGELLGVLLLDMGVGGQVPDEAVSLTGSVSEQVSRSLLASRVSRQRQRETEDRCTRMFRTRKLDALANTAAGIARTLNNSLGPVLGFSELALEAANDRSTLREHLLHLVKGAEHTRTILDQIGSIGRRALPEPGLFALGPMVKDLAKLCSAISPELEVVSHIADPLPNVVGDPSQLQQLLLHVGVNALKALREGGKLSIRLERFEVDRPFAEAYPELKTGPHLHLSISDTGTGISEEILGRVFEPFATDTPGPGPGLGLAVAYGVARAHSGTVQLASTLGQGTTVDVYLPAAATETIASGAAGIEAPVGSGERVIYVDDDATSCLLTARLLERLGYNYQGFDNPQEALAWFSSNSGQVDIALCDFSLPSTTGIEVAAELLRQRPELPVILTSAFAGGWSNEAVRRKYGVREIIGKPLQLSTLGKALARNLLPEELSDPEDMKPDEA